MSIAAFFSMANISGTLVLDPLGRLVVLAEGVEPRVGDVVLQLLDNEPDGNLLGLVSIQPDGVERSITIDAALTNEAADIIAQIEAGGDPTLSTDLATAAGESQSEGSATTTTATVDATLDQVLAATFFETLGLSSDFLNPTQTNTLIGIIANAAPVTQFVTRNYLEESQDGELNLTYPTDADGDTLTITVTELPELGTVTLADGTPLEIGQVLTQQEFESLLYDAPQEYTLGDNVGQLTYSVDDGSGDENAVQQGGVILSVTPINDIPVIDSVGSGEVVEAGVDEEGNPVAIGFIQASDNDTDAILSYSVEEGSSDYGQLTVDPLTGAWTFTLDNTSDATQLLKEGEETSIDFTLVVTDDQGARVTETLTITLQGSNDLPVILDASDLAGRAVEAGHLDSGTVVSGTPTASGSLQAQDVDADAQLSFSTVNGNSDYGTLVVDTSGDWTFTLNNESPQTQGLMEGETLDIPFTVAVEDEFGASSTRILTITIEGTNDKPEFTAASVLEGAVTEAGTEREGSDVATGTLFADDVDNNATQIYTLDEDGVTDYGTMVLQENGLWTFTLDNDLPATQALVEGQVEQLTFPVTVTDEFGATDNQIITITITGSNDAAVVSGLDTGNVVEDSGVTETGLLTDQGQLLISDVDAGEAKFDSDSVTPINDDNGFTPVGTLTIDETGAWSYQIDNSDPSVQSLPEGVTRTETFQVLTEDGTPHEIVITITGVNDVPSIVSGADGSATEDALVNLDDSGNLVATNTLVIDDADSGEQAFNAGNAIPVGDTFGSLTINAAGEWTYTVNNSLPQIQALDVGTSITESFVVTSIDGTEHTIDVQIFGTEDPSIISSYESGLVVEDTAGILTDTGDIDIADLDAGEALFDDSRVDPQANGDQQLPLGTLTITETGQWSYQVDNSLAGVQELGDGETRDEVFRVYSIDGSVFQDIVVTIQGINGVPTIVSGDTGTVTEDVSPNTAGNLVATNTLVISDEDTGEAVFNAGTATPVGSTLGSLTIDAAGVWTYTVDNNLPAVQGLDVGDSVIESFVVTSADGTEHTISVTLNGAEDQTFITDYAPDEVTEDSEVVAGELIGSGSLTISDKDFGEEAFDTASVIPLANDAGQLPLGNLTITSDGDWTYKVVNSLEEVQELGAGETRIERFEVSSIDGTASQIIEVTINGTADEPVIAGDGVGTVTEDTEVQDGLLKESGQLTIDDPDSGESLFDPDSVTPLDDDNDFTPVGTLTIDETGAWSYQIDNSDPSVQSLPEGVTRTETFQVLTEDGTPHNIVVTITGTNDLPMIDGISYGLMTEDEGSQIDGDGNLFFSSQATISDVDVGEGAFIPSSVTPAVGNFTDGVLTINAVGEWTYKIPNSSSNVQGLAAGETVTQTFTVTTDNQTTHTITVDIVGVNDASVLIGNPTAGQGYVIEDETPVELRDSGTLILSDPDGVEEQVFQTNPDTITSTSNLQGATEALGILTINPQGQWDYSIPNGFVEYLADGELAQETFTVLSADGTPHVITITIEGTNDVPVIVGGTTAEGTEDQGLDGNNIKVQGTAVIDDADANQNTFQAGMGSAAAGNTLGGTLTIDAAGNWTYLVDNTQDAVQSLDVGDTVTETFTVLSFDGTPIDIQVTVNGAEDETFITDYAPDTVYEDDDNADGELVGSGTLTISDLDAGEDAFDINSVIKLDNDSGQQPLGELTISAQGVWTYKVANSVDGVQQLDSGETRIERFQVSSIDGTKTQIIEVTIVGTADLPVIAGDGVGAVTEDFEVTTDNLIDLLTDNGQLTIDDADAGQSLFNPTSVTKLADSNGFIPVGSLTITAQGAWAYEIDNNHPSVQSLGEGETRTETFQVLSEDGSPYNIVVTITGVNDIPTVSSGADGSVIEDVAFDSNGDLVAINTLVIADADIGQATFNAGIAAPVGTVYGELSINAAGEWVYKVDNSLAQIQALDANTSITESFVVTSIDGTEHTISVQVFGMEDPSIISSYEPGLVVEDTAGILTDSGDLNISDLDAGEALFDDSRVESRVNDDNQMPLGTLTITESGQWSYQVDNSLAGVQELGDGDTRQEVFRVYSIDGSAFQDIVVTIQGVNGEPTIVSGETGSVTEDVNPVQPDDNLVATNTLVISDEDGGEATFNAGTATPVGSPLGTLTITAAGVWTYTVNNNLAAVQALDEGDVLEESFIVTSVDGTPHTITVQVNGAEDETYITNYQPDTVYEDDDNADGELIGGGTLTIIDLDDGEDAFDINSVVKLNNLDGQQPLGELTITANGVWSYKVLNSVEGVQELGNGETRIERFQVSSIDGTKTQIIEVTIVGTNDLPVITGNGFGAVTEDVEVTTENQVDLLTDNGQLIIDDADAGQSLFNSTSVTKLADSNGFIPVGSLTITAQGAWAYEIDNNHPSVQSLGEGETRTETFQVLSEDGSPYNIVVTVYGTNDIPTISVINAGSPIYENSSDTPATSGDLDPIDVDTSDIHTWSLLGSNQGQYGTFDLDSGNGTWDYYLVNDSVEFLQEGERVFEYFQVKVDDGNGGTAFETVAIEIIGTNDQPEISGDGQGLVIEDGGALSFTKGNLEVDDVDIKDVHTWRVEDGAGRYGDLTINSDGEWTYTLDQSKANFMEEGVIYSEDTFTVIVEDGNGGQDTFEVNVNIEGNNDAPNIKNVKTITVREDVNDFKRGVLRDRDPDENEDHTWVVLDANGDVMQVENGAGIGVYGNMSIEIDANGVVRWRYDMQVSQQQQDATQALELGEEKFETFTIQVTDKYGAVDTQLLTVKVIGTNDTPIIEGDISGDVTEDVTLTASGTLEPGDVDTNDTHTWSLDTNTGDYGSIALVTDPITGIATWTYTLNNSNPAVQALHPGDAPLTETFTVKVVDDSIPGEENPDQVDTQVITINIYGSNDAPTLSGQTFGSVVEPLHKDFTDQISVSGDLVVSDTDNRDVERDALGEPNGYLFQLTVDNGDPNSANSDSFTSNYGTLSVDSETKTWTYVLDNLSDDTKAIPPGTTVYDTFDVVVTDELGASSTIQVQVAIAGTNTEPLIQAAGTYEIVEDGAALQGRLVKGNPTQEELEQGDIGSGDLDMGDDAQWQVSSNGKYGIFEISDDGESWTYTLFTSDDVSDDPSRSAAYDAVNALSEGESLFEQDQVTIRVTDEFGITKTQTLSIDIIGANDMPNIGGVNATFAEDNLDQGIFSTTGQLTDGDVDANDTHVWTLVDPDASIGQYGTFVLQADGTWTYNVDPAKFEEIQNLNPTDSDGAQARELVDTFEIQVTDMGGSGVTKTETFTVTIAADNDIPVVTGDTTGSYVEDSNSTVTGTATLFDRDNNDEAFFIVPDPSDPNSERMYTGLYGNLTINASGQWTYTPDETKLQSLPEGPYDSAIVDSFFVLAQDTNGATITQEISIDIIGNNDIPEIDGEVKGTVYEDGDEFDPNGIADFTIAEGQLFATDVDQNSPTRSWSIVDDPNGISTGTGVGQYGTLTLDNSGKWVYVLDNENPDVQALNFDSAPLTETFYVVVSDNITDVETNTPGFSVPQPITIEIYGQNEDDGSGTGGGTPTVIVVDVTEDSADQTETQTVPSDILSIIPIQGGLFGDITFEPVDPNDPLNEAQQWTYTLDNDSPLVQALDEGEVVQEVWRITTENDGVYEITVNIQGTADAPQIFIGDQELQENDVLGEVIEDSAPFTSGRLSVEDADADEQFVWSIDGDTTINSALGTITIDPDTGEWTYQLRDDVELAPGQEVFDYFDVRATDTDGIGTADENSAINSDTHQIRIKITGTSDNIVSDKPVIATTIQTYEDPQDRDPALSPISSGTLSLDNLVDDTGQPINNSLGDDIAWTLVDGSSPYGSMVVSEDGSYTFTLNNNSNAVQRLADGEVVQQVFEVYAVDQFGKTIVDESGIPQTLEIVVDIEGSNDAPTVTTLVDSLVAETDAGSVQSISGSLQSNADDIDNDNVLEWSQLTEVDVPNSDYGTLVVNDDGSYVFTLDTTNGEPHPDIVALNEGESLTLKWSVMVTDNEPSSVPVEQMIEITIVGTNEQPEITTSLTATISESAADDNQKPYEDATPDIVQQIVLSDRDSGGDLGDVVTLDSKQLLGSYGVFQVDSDAQTWSYTLYNEPHINALAQGVSVTETFAIRATDEYGGEVMAFVDVTITGTNDAPTVEGTLTGTVIDQPDATATGQLVVTDPDAGDTHIFSWPDVNDLPDGVKSFSVDADGNWTFTLDTDAEVVKNLPKGEITTITVDVTATDLGGTGITSEEKAIVITVVGTNDAPEIQDVAVQNVVEDTLVTLSGTFDSGDPDNEINPDSQSRVDGEDADSQTWQVVSGDSRGSLVVNPATGAWTFNLVDSFDYLAEGETLATPLQYVVQVTDEFGLSDQKTIEFQVTGTNDAPTIDTVNTTTTGTVYEDPTDMEADSTQGIITFDDLDVTDTHSISLDSGSVMTTLQKDYGTLTLTQNPDGTIGWDYTLNQAAADSLEDETVSETFNVYIESQVNGVSQGDAISVPIVVTIEGKNDAPVVTTAVGQNVGSVVEDSGPLSATGTLSATDSDSEVLTFSFTPTVDNPQSQYGQFSVTSGGAWTYTLDSNLSQALNSGSITEIFEVEVSDGTNVSTEMVTITLQGNNDAPIITTSVAQLAGAVTEDLNTAQTATGTLTASDPESQTVTYSFSGTQSQYGEFSVSSGGVWNYVLNGNSQMLNVDGDSESFIVDVTDGVNQTTETITITFTGSNDLPVINGVFLGDVQEGVKESVTGSLTATDVDGPDANISRVLNGGVLGGDGKYTKVSPYGSLTFDPLAGTWVYLLIASDSLPSLGSTVFDTFTVDVEDGSGTVVPQEIRIEIAGNNVVRGESNMSDLIAATSDDEWLFGNDILVNGDTTTDASQSDEFIWDATALGASGADIIKDFDVRDVANPSQPHDVINLQAVVFDSNALLTDQILLSEVDGSVVIEVSTSSVSQIITLENVSLAQLLGVDVSEVENISPANMLLNLYLSDQLQLDEDVFHIGTSGDDGDVSLAFTGSAGSDIIYGAGGNDILVGNGGNDLFLFTEEAAGAQATPSMQTVNDFSVGSDLLDISDLLPEHEDLDDLLSNIEIEVNDAASAMDSSSTVIKVSNGDGHTQITLEGIGSNELGITGGAASLDQSQLLNQLSEVMNVIKVDP